jgi:hypothetical protein
MLSDHLETDAKTQLSNHDISPRMMNINGSQFCNLTSRRSANTKNIILLTESGKEQQESPENNVGGDVIPSSKEKFEIDILS